MPVTCPFCRAEWGAIEMVRRGHPNSPFVHGRSTCGVCGMTPIIGPRLRCLVCAEYNLCVGCYKAGGHSEHSFQCYDTNGSVPRVIDTTEENREWIRRRQSEREEHEGRLRALAQLQLREITPQDYALLLELDRPSSHTNHTRLFPMSKRLISLIFFLFLLILLLLLLLLLPPLL